MARSKTIETEEQELEKVEEKSSRAVLLKAVPDETDQQREARILYNNNLRRDNFSRLAKFRVNRLIKNIGGVGNLSGPNYLYTQDQVLKMFGALEKALVEAQSRFSKSTVEQETFDF